MLYKIASCVWLMQGGVLIGLLVSACQARNKKWIAILLSMAIIYSAIGLFYLFYTV